MRPRDTWQLTTDNRKFSHLRMISGAVEETRGKSGTSKCRRRTERETRWHFVRLHVSNTVFHTGWFYFLIRYIFLFLRTLQFLYLQNTAVYQEYVLYRRNWKFKDSYIYRYVKAKAKFAHCFMFTMMGNDPMRQFFVWTNQGWWDTGALE